MNETALRVGGAPGEAPAKPPLPHSEEAIGLYNAALERQKAGDVDGAIALYSQALRLAPDFVQAYNNLALRLRKQPGRVAAAIAYLRRAAAIAPDNAMVHANLGNALAQVQEFEAAVEAFERAQALAPELYEIHLNYGVLQIARRDYAAAIQCFDRALALRPNDPRVQWNRALALLASGDYARGFAAYDSRFAGDRAGAGLEPLLRKLQSVPLPLWEGQPLAGRTLYLYAEQGLGDTLQFARFLPEAAARGARVIFDCPGELLRLFASLGGIGELRPLDSPPPAADFQLPLMSLPARLGITLETLPGRVPYLASPPDRALRRPPGTRLAIGIVWAGRAETFADDHRSIGLEAFFELSALPGVALYSLQKGPRAGDIARLGAEALIHDLGPEIADFADTARLMQQLDLIITIDSAPAHLAGALGRPAMVLLSIAADWRWAAADGATPWYPSLSLFRQARPGDWKAVMRAVRAAVERRLAEASGVSSVPDPPPAISAWACNNAGVRLLGEPGRRPAAIACLKRAAALAPGRAIVHSNLANALRLDQAFDAAAAAFQRALALDPQLWQTHRNLGLLHFALRDYQAAVATFDRALGLKPDDRGIPWDRALALLAGGDYARGFAAFDARFDLDDAAIGNNSGLRGVRSLPLPLWQGEDIAGRTLWVYAEQGFGDTLHFARFIPLLAERGARVIFDVQPALLRLFQSLAGVAALRPLGAALDAADFHLPLMSLPARLGITREQVPAAPYLAPPPGPGAPLPRPTGTRLAIGIAWAGNAQHPQDHHRSMTLEAFFALADIPGVALYSLQKGPRAADIASLGAEWLIHDLAPEITDFADAARFVQQLDLVITVDSALAHLAGALGCEGLVLLPFSPDWRWLGGRPENPWYPRLRLLRQSVPGDWARVMQDVRAAVESAVAVRRSDDAAPRPDRAEEAVRLYNTAVQRQKDGDLAGAAALYGNAFRLHPALTGAANNLAVLLTETGRLAAAIACLRRALLAAPDSAMLHANLGNLLWRHNAFAAAAAEFERALALAPEMHQAHHNRGLLQYSLGDYRAAIESFDRALALAPGYRGVLHDRVLAVLASGDYARGLPAYDVRLEQDQRTQSIPLPLWNGEAIAGRTLYLHAEQGFGDTLQFARFIPLAAEAGAQVIFACPPALLRLFTGMPGIAALSRLDDPSPAADFQLPLMSLPARLGITLETLPRRVPYLAPPPDGGPVLRRPPGTRLAIGIVWAGRPQHVHDRDRSATLEDFLALAEVPGVALFSVQKGERSADIARIGAELLVEDLAPEIRDFADTARLLQQLDLLVTVDSSPAHLAGALGRPALVLLPFAPDWRWLGGAPENPWYPSLRLFRQNAPGDWAGVMAELVDYVRSRWR
ncbi:MAG TPA: tetratricopeptide repeat protein [Stellaceae bacterium]|nr:tetratricopeptide repeat protein [Stellaceae bacterium]